MLYLHTTRSGGLRAANTLVATTTLIGHVLALLHTFFDAQELAFESSAKFDKQLALKAEEVPLMEYVHSTMSIAPGLIVRAMLSLQTEMHWLRCPKLAVVPFASRQ